MSSDSPDDSTPQLRLVICYRDPIEVEVVPFTAAPGMGLDVMPREGRTVARIQIQVMLPGPQMVHGMIVADSGELHA